MTTLIAIDGHKPGSRRSVEVARRFRSELGALDISASEAARRCGRTQAWMARRTSGKTAFDVDDLDMVCSVLGISYDYVAAGIREISPPPRKKDGTADYQNRSFVPDGHRNAG
jgi:transcriptional regulator with XRE-family HTH domain